MDPATGNYEIFPFFFKLMVDLISIGHYSSGESFQELLISFCLPFQGQGIGVSAIYDGGNQCRSSDTVPKKISGTSVASSKDWYSRTAETAIGTISGST